MTHTPYSPAPTPGVPGGTEPPRRRGGAWTVIATVLLILSALANIVLLVMLFVAFAMVGSLGSTMGSAPSERLEERVVVPGEGRGKIAVIPIEGIIDDEQVAFVECRIDQAARDKRVKAVILRINSPGGGLTASDQIYHLVKARLTVEKPVVVAMDALAASGGYYIACAGEHIVAQPTTITGSIGVIAQFFYLNELMSDKLGIEPVTLTMGRQKDWPNVFADRGMTDQERNYLMETILRPGYDRFVGIVQTERGLDTADMPRLATGRVFLADEAVREGLIDEVGYFERAVEVARTLAGLEDAPVVEYRDRFRLGELFGFSAEAREALDFGPERLAALATPKVMTLWTGQ